MLITRKQIRAMILREMVEAEIIPFPGMKPAVDEAETMMGVYMALKSIAEAARQMKGAARVGRRGVGSPAGQIAEDVVGTTSRMLREYLEAVATLAAEDELADAVLALLEGLDRLLATADEDPSAVRAVAMEIGRMISMSRDLLSDIESRYGLGEEL